MMTITGIVLYIMPYGRVAYWTGWEFLSLDKDQWDSLHTIFGFLMVFFGVWHLILNWKSFVSYFKDKVKNTMSKEFFVSTLVVVFISTGTIMNFQPFKGFIELGKKIKESWPTPKVLPPAPHTELFSLEKVAVLVGISKEEAL